MKSRAMASSWALHSAAEDELSGERTMMRISADFALVFCRQFGTYEAHDGTALCWARNAAAGSSSHPVARSSWASPNRPKGWAVDEVVSVVPSRREGSCSPSRRSVQKSKANASSESSRVPADGSERERLKLSQLPHLRSHGSSRVDQLCRSQDSPYRLIELQLTLSADLQA